MQITRFRAVNIHSYISFSLTFNRDLTFLTGINGAGKTVAVRALVALLSPSFRELTSFQFEELSVEVFHHEAFHTITASRSDTELFLRHSGVEETLSVAILKTYPLEGQSRFEERQRDYFREQEALLQKHPVLVAIQQLPTPMFLDLDRRQDEVSLRSLPGRSHNPLTGSLVDSLVIAESMAEQAFRQFAGIKTQLTDTLKQDIILAAFQIGKEDGFKGFLSVLAEPPALAKITKDESVVRQSLSDLGISKERQNEIVTPFFFRLREVSADFPGMKKLASPKAYKDKDFLAKIQEWSALQPKVAQIDELVKLIDRYNALVRDAREPIERYLGAVNKFFADSAKHVSFDASANLRITVSDKRYSRPIAGLSSGERQLIVILTHLAFNKKAKTANILIIDEPELSLHLRWQELFVDAVRDADPGVQLILATHSPSVIGERVEHCIDVEEARLSALLFE